MPVRSRRLFGPVANGTGSQWNTLFTVPAGRTAVVHLLTMTNASGSARVCRIGVKASGIDNYVHMSTLAGGSSVELLRGMVLNPGDELEVYVDGTNQILFGMFGSLLLGDPT